MKYIITEELKPDMVTVKNIYNNNGVCLLSNNKKLTPSIIKQIKKMGYNGLYIYDEYSDYEKLEEIISDEERIQAVKELKSLNIDSVLFLTNKIVDSLLNSNDICLDANDLRFYHNYTYEHSINVTMLATACGIGMGLNTYQLNNLAAAAILHDIGKRAISKKILDKPGKLTDEERKTINTHSKIGYNMLKDNDNIKSTTRIAVLSHHENEDGTGYPRGLKGNKIHLFAKIIHVADVYDALCSKRSYKEDYKPSEAIEYLMGNCGTMFDQTVVETFLKYIVVYPVGTDVLLSNGKTAHVIKNRNKFILRPVVILEDKTIIDLAYDEKYFSLTIVK